MTAKKTTKKTTTGAKTAKTTSASEKRVKADKQPAIAAKKAAVTAAAVVAPEVKVAPAVTAKLDVPPAAKTAPVITEVKAPVDAQPSRVVPQHEVQALVREAAFLFAKRRQFRNGTPTQDWLAAEAFVNERLSARGYVVAR